MSKKMIQMGRFIDARCVNLHSSVRDGLCSGPTRVTPGQRLCCALAAPEADWTASLGVALAVLICAEVVVLECSLGY